MTRHFLLVALLLLACPLLVVASELSGYTEDVPPLNYQNKSEVAGFASELLTAMASKAGLSIDLQVLPWARAYALVQTTPNTILYSTVRTPEREKLFNWIGPISTRHIYLYRLERRNDIKLQSIDQLPRYRVSAMFESASAKRLQELGLKPDQELDVGRNDLVNLNKLKLNRVDLVAMLDWAMSWQLPLAGMRPGDVRPAAILDGSHQYWYAVNRQTPDSMIIRLQNALDGLVKAGYVDKLRQKYLAGIEQSGKLPDFSAN